MPLRVTWPITNPSSLTTPWALSGEVRRRTNIAKRLPTPTTTTLWRFPPPPNCDLVQCLGHRRSAIRLVGRASGSSDTHDEDPANSTASRARSSAQPDTDVSP